MAKTWYYGLCESCGEGIQMFVSNPSCTQHLLGEYDKEIQAFLLRHFNCDLRLINTDTDIDWLWYSGYQHDKNLKIRIYNPKIYHETTARQS